MCNKASGKSEEIELTHTANTKIAGIVIRSVAETDVHKANLQVAAEKTRSWILTQRGTALELLHSLKFEAVGFHPAQGHALNFIEQLNQTATYAAAFEATRLLLELHPDEEGFILAPGAHMSLPLDIMSIEEGDVGAEVFAAVRPSNNQKLKNDLDKMVGRARRTSLWDLGWLRVRGD